MSLVTGDQTSSIAYKIVINITKINIMRRNESLCFCFTSIA